MRPQGEDTPVRVADALGVLFAALLVFFEIRHAINGGDPFARTSGLVEQGLMAVSAFGFAIVLTRLDAARANIVFRIASLAAGALGGLAAAFGLIVFANPFFTNDTLEGGTIINGLLLGYLLPSLLAGVLALIARGVRPIWYWGGAAVLAAVLGLAYVFLEVRVFAMGERLGFWDHGFRLGELGVDASISLALAWVAGLVDRRAAYVMFGLAALIAVPGLCGMVNPLLTNLEVGGGGVLNTLLIAYLLPALLCVALARQLEAPAPRIAAILWLFAYVTLETRRLFAGAWMGLDNEFSKSEIYAYSAVWLALGVALLVYGVWRASRETRYASAFFVFATTLKVFLYDFSGLEGVLRALSFIGLGLALIGIGLVYQRFVFAPRRVPTTE